jgi:quinol-cytochrome oxidoreductase complex cytochrome b subunit
VTHDLILRWPFVGRAVADWIIGPMFVNVIAGRTLRRIKTLVESGGGE